MRGLSLVAVLGLTSVAGYLVGTRRVGLSRAGLKGAAAAALETIGLGVVFFAANLAVTLVPLIAAPRGGGWFGAG